MTHDFILTGADTDSIMFCKKDSSPFSNEEQENLLKELNSLFPKGISWEHDGIYNTVVYLKAKNYILYDGKKIKTKGSALRDQKKPRALREFCDEIIATIIANDEDPETMKTIYMKYVNEILNIKDISRWATKKTITDKVLNGTRANETKVKDAFVNTNYVEGDKIYIFFKSDKTMSLIENFDGDYHVNHLLEALYKVSQVFKNVLHTEDLFKNYKLKKNKGLLCPPMV